MIDQEELLKVSSMLAKETLVKDVTIGDIEYKAGEKIPLDVIKILADLLFVLSFNHI